MMRHYANIAEDNRQMNTVVGAQRICFGGFGAALSTAPGFAGGLRTDGAIHLPLGASRAGKEPPAAAWG